MIYPLNAKLSHIQLSPKCISKTWLRVKMQMINKVLA